MRIRPHRQGFTLVELLVVIGVVALLAALAVPTYDTAVAHAHASACASNMHGLGIAFISYAYDNEGLLPGRVTTGPRWPSLLLPYVGNDARIFVDPGDKVAMAVPLTQVVSDTVNNSSFIFNGFNDLGAHEDPNYQVSLYNVPSSASLILLGEQKPGGNNFYMDVNDGDQNKVLAKTAYFGGSNYVFADGSMRHLKVSEYNDNMWLVNQSYVIP